MGEDQRAIARALRRPMRRWWLRYGSWWVGAILLLYATAILVGWGVTRAWVVNGKFNQPLDIFTAVCASLAILLSALCWIFAAYRANAEISGVLSGFAHPREHEVRRARLALCFAQGVALILVVAVLHSLLSLQSIHLGGLLDAKGPGGVLPVGPLWYLSKMSHEALRNIWPIPFCMLWVCALLAARPDRPLLSFPWTLPALVPQALEFVAMVDFQRAAALPAPGLIRNMGQLPYIHFGAIWALGFILMLLLVWGLVSDRRRLWQVLYVLLVIAVIAHIPNQHAVAINVNPPADQPIIYAANVLGEMTALSLVQPLEYAAQSRQQWTDRSGNPLDRPPPTSGTLRIRSAYFGVVKDLPNWWAIVALLGNLAWLIAQYFILSALLGWRVRRTTRGNAAAGR